MLSKTYPQHDINLVFDEISRVLSSGNVADNAMEELSFQNRLFAALPVEAVEYGMQFLHGKIDLPKACDEILPLYMRFLNLVKYTELIEAMENIPKNPTPEELTSRIRMHGELGKIEESFCTPLLGFAYNKDLPEGKIDPEKIEPKGPEDSDGSSNLHLMNSLAPVFVCEDPYRTSAFYEDHLGFHAAHLDDESMPHIRISRDNIEINLVKGTPVSTGAPYDLYIYVSEPMMLQMELQSSGVKLIKTLEESDAISHMNREFIFEDIDKRHICVSQRDISQ